MSTVNPSSDLQIERLSTVSFSSVRPTTSMNLLSHREIAGVMATNDEVFQLFRDCALAILNSGGVQNDAASILSEYADFDIHAVPQSRGIKLEIHNAPATAFVDGVMIQGIQVHLFSALRDIVYTHHKMTQAGKFDMQTGPGITDAVFRILRNADIAKPDESPNLAVCWGGHAIGREEYDYSKLVGYHIGLRGMDIATGCGIGAMKGPMKGAVVGHRKQQINNGRYIGISEPGIIAAESPNPTVSELVILPDIEKRLEAFVRLAHCVVVFPGGAGTAEEVLYLLGLLMHPDNQGIPLPIIFAAPEGKEDYFVVLDKFIRSTLGDEATRFYEIIVGQPEKVAQRVRHGIKTVQRYRRQTHESYAFNWSIDVPFDLQQPFIPTHENMANLNLDSSLPPHELAAQLRRAFSGIVAGNVKAFGIQQIRDHGPYLIKGEPQLIAALDSLLRSFVEQKRMTLHDSNYQPCYRLQQ